MTTVDNHHIVNSHSSVAAINGTSIKSPDGKVVVDEEIDSCEGEDYDEKMFQVALVNSVMDTGGNQAPGEMSPRSKARYALRKRRRPGEETPAAPPLATGVLDFPNDPLNELQHIQDNTMPMPSIQHLPPPTQIKQEPAPTHSTIPIKQEQHSMGVTARGHSTQGTIPKAPGSSAALLPNTTFQAPQQRRPVANIKKKPARKRKAKPAKAPAKTKVTERLSISVPNPLLASTSPAPSMNHPVMRGRQDLIASSSSVPCPLSVPSPLDAGSSMQVKPTKKLVTPAYLPPFDPSKLTKVSETTSLDMPLSRTRVFSVDLDPSTFDFSDLSSITGGNADKGPADADLPIFQGRDRAFSFEVFNFAGGDDLLPNPVSSGQMLQAPSLAPVNVEQPTRRPRGDSIIFDPSSFQEGGIHEKNALEKARLRDLIPAAPAPAPQIMHRTTQRRVPTAASGGITGTYSTSQSSNPLPLMLPPGHGAPLVAGQSLLAHPARSNIATTKARTVPSTGGSRASTTGRNSMQIATLPSSLSAGAASNAQSPPTFQMELLNKDGRIGIYLPEARRIRIARFHAKRKMRIWRKRIKYDCRKKLADSRPRIKGRFVKRSDMD
eukprot:CAMPEP_0116147142 /NCGR_PEP_ID=MMETSP0329-20121206/17589_1 /TAXON_ID=697910 /ORGANISM="Pseudo-nitzschia arenysensis, Strain B593" /LENGTH=605 /DNA_ID=CAMNT_0003643035 /DNA_START=84 /DNA_END=1901 /DNA_ORIENTATION=+